MSYIAKIDVEKLGEYKNKVVSDEVVLTEERKLHIYESHKKDYEEIMKNIRNAILNPQEIIEDIKNKDTVFFIGKLKKNNLNVIVKLNASNNLQHPKNSIMTAWIIRDKNLNKLREKHKIIYKAE